MRVLILSCNTGEGHNSCAKALKEVFDAKGETCVTEDSLGFISERESRVISRGHVFVYRKLPWLFNFGYGVAEKHPSCFKEKSLLYKYFSKGADGLYRFIVRGSYDTVVCVHPFASLMLTETQKRYHLPIKTAFVATDYTCSPSVKDSALDYYFIPDERLSGDFECRNIPKDKQFFSGIPIRQSFFVSMSKDEAKGLFGIEPECKHAVMMCGSMGCGPIEKSADVLTEKLKEGFDLTVVCGTNDKLKKRLERKYGERKNLHVLGFVTDVSALLDSADLYLTKAGGISVTEAATKKLPMFFMNAVAGCETYNGDFFAVPGCAVKSGSVKELVGICNSLIKNGTGYNQMVAAFNNLPIRNGAEIIYTTLKQSSQG